MLKRSLDHDNVHLHLHSPMHPNIQLHAHKNVRLPREPFYQELIPACFRLGWGLGLADGRRRARVDGRPRLHFGRAILWVWVLARLTVLADLSGVRSELA
jgi:hypothetical protein